MNDTTRFRVYEPGLKLSGARTSFFHNSIGGYHGAKPRRFEELYDYFSTHQISAVMDMLNVKYLLIQEKGEQQVIENPNVLGTSWTVDSIAVESSADRVLEAMKITDFKHKAIVLKSEIPNDLALEYDAKALKKLELIKYQPTHLKYEYEAEKQQLVVFSEMFYPKGWTATVNRKKTDIFPVNYVLRAIQVPSGKHSIEFIFDPPVVHQGVKIRWVSLLIFVIGVGFFGFKKIKRDQR